MAFVGVRDEVLCDERGYLATQVTASKFEIRFYFSLLINLEQTLQNDEDDEDTKNF